MVCEGDGDGDAARECGKEMLGRTPTVVRLAQCCAGAGDVEGAGADGGRAEWRGSGAESESGEEGHSVLEKGWG